MTCPTCGSSASVLVTNIQTGTKFCYQCSVRECPSFLPTFILTLDDARFLRACGVDPEIHNIEAFLAANAVSSEATRTLELATPVMLFRGVPLDNLRLDLVECQGDECGTLIESKKSLCYACQAETWK